MRDILQRFWHTSVRRHGQELLQAETVYFDSGRELTARLTAGGETW